MIRWMPVLAALWLSAIGLFQSGCSKQQPQNVAPDPTPSSSAQPGRKAANKQHIHPQTVRPPPGFVEMTVGGVAPTEQGHAVLLTDSELHKAVPIFVGQTEALSIQLRLQRRRYSRPLTHDLMDDIMGRVGAKVTSVRVDKLQDNIFYGVVVVDDGKKSSEIDARSSDAVALALGQRAPIFVAKAVVEKAGISLDDVPDLEPVPTDAEQPDSSEPAPVSL